MTGDVALLLPGMTLNASVFPNLGMPAVAVDFTKLVVGPEGWSAELEHKRMAFYVERLAERLRREPAWTGARRRVVVAHSFGGFLALAWQLAAQGDALARIDGLVLVGTCAGPLFQAVRLRLFGGERWAARIPVHTLMRLWNNPALTRVIGGVTAPRDGAQDVNFRALNVRSDFRMGLLGWRNTDWRARRSYRFAMLGFDVRERLGTIATPAIVLHGPRDSFFALDVARDMARRLPHAELRIVPGAAHALPLTHGAAIVRAVRDLLPKGGS